MESLARNADPVEAITAAVLRADKELTNRSRSTRRPQLGPVYGERRSPAVLRPQRFHMQSEPARPFTPVVPTSVSPQDLNSAVLYALSNEIGQRGDIVGREYDALKAFIRAVIKWVPVRINGEIIMNWPKEWPRLGIMEFVEARGRSIHRLPSALEGFRQHGPPLLTNDQPTFLASPSENRGKHSLPFAASQISTALHQASESSPAWPHGAPSTPMPTSIAPEPLPDSTELQNLHRTPPSSGTSIGFHRVPGPLPDSTELQNLHRAPEPPPDSTEFRGLHWA